MTRRKWSERADGSYSRTWRTVSKLVLRPGIRMLMHLDWRGQEHVPADGAMILAANHLSYTDIFAISLFADSAGRYPVFLAKASLFDIPVVGAIIGRLGQLPVHRGATNAAVVLKDAELVANSGACVIFYPESTVTRDPEKWPMLAKTGVARLALTTGAPVIPIAHWGAQRLLPYGKFVPRVLPRKTVKVLAGPPVDLSEFAGKPLNSQTLRAATDKIMTAVAGLLGELRGETPPTEFYHPAVARRQLRQELRALQDATGQEATVPGAGGDQAATGQEATVPGAGGDQAGQPGGGDSSPGGSAP